MMSAEVPSIPSHEGRLLRLADDAFEAPPVAHPSDSFLLELDQAASASSASALFTDHDLLYHTPAALPEHSKLSDFTQTADLKQHKLAMDEAISRKAAGKAYSSQGQSATAAAESSSSEAAATDEDSSPQRVGDSEGMGHISDEDMLGMVGLSATPASPATPSPTASHTDSHAVTEPSSHVANHTHRHHHDSTHANTPPAQPICPTHKDLPIPGMDIAPADKDRCYTHPHIYKNNNYLNDSNYMLYHHDIPTIHPHPAFAWGDIARFAQVSHKMRRKEPVTVTFVGGSVSSSYCQNPSVTCWVAPVSAWLQEQNPAVQIINNAVGGTTSRTTAECFDAMVGKDADLIFLEYSYNDRWATAPCWWPGYSSGDVSAVLWLQSVCQNMKHVYMHAHADSPASSSCQAYVHVHVAAFSVAPTGFIL